MRFSDRKRRTAPAVIIVSLIDVLIVVLIFMMVTTTFQQQPAVKLSLPESRQPADGATEKLTPLIVDIAKVPPFLYLGGQPVTADKLEEKLVARVKDQPASVLSIRADAEAPFGQVVRVMDAAKAARIKSVSAYTKQPGQK